jgi:hypothetical protein
VTLATINIDALDRTTQEANVRLMAASPDLFEACKMTLKQIQILRGSKPPTLAEELAQAAIAKAEGK